MGNCIQVSGNPFSYMLFSVRFTVVSRLDHFLFQIRGGSFAEPEPPGPYNFDPVRTGTVSLLKVSGTVPGSYHKNHFIFTEDT